MWRRWDWATSLSVLSVETVIAFGSNIGDAQERFGAALRMLEGAGRVLARSSLYRTRPWGDKEQDDFTNAAVHYQTRLRPVSLLAHLQEVERACGKHVIRKNGPRTLDLDIIFYGDEVIETGNLVVPHPRATERDFVLYPVAEICPEWRHPVLHKTARELKNALQGESFVTDEVRKWHLMM